MAHRNRWFTVLNNMVDVPSINGITMGFNGKLMGFYSDSMGY